MLSFAQMERHYRLLEIIDQYQRLLAQYDTGLRAARLDGMPHNRNHNPDRFGDMLMEKENAEKKLQKLQALAEIQNPQVEETIKAVCGRGRDTIKGELILWARYVNGRDWPEIAEMIREPYAQRVKEFALRHLERVK